MSYLGDRAKAIGSISPTKNVITGDSIAANLARGDIEGAGAASKSHKGAKAATLAQQMQDKDDEQYGKNQDYSAQMGANDQKYLSTMGGNVNKYQGDLDALTSETQAAQKNAQNTYSNDVQPRMKDLMEQAQQNASSAMSLKDSMDPNNAVAASTRKLYSDQAQNEGRTGLASAATLQALGAQNFGTQVGGAAGPMTGGQLAALMGQNQAASSAAYGNTQKRMQDLQDQGLTQGFARSDLAYNNGRQAVNDYGQSVGNYQNADALNQQQQAGYRGERGGYSGQTYGLQQQMNDATRGVNNAGIQRDMSIYNTHMGGAQAGIAAQIQGINADRAADAATTTAGLQAAGTIGGAVVGAYAAGPAGAAQGAKTGNQVGGEIGQANAPSPIAVPQAGNYNGYQSPSSGKTAPSNYVEQSSANGLGLTDDPYARQSMASRMRQ